MAWVLGEVNDGKHRKVRVDAKFKPNQTRVGVPLELKDHRKTTMAKDRNTGKWYAIENRIPAKDFMNIDTDKICAVLIFMQEPRH